MAENHIPDKKPVGNMRAPDKSGGSSPNAGVKKVQSVNGPESSTNMNREPSKPSGGFGPINAIRNGLSDLIGGGARALKSGLSGLVHGGGPARAGKGVVSGVRKLAAFLSVPPLVAGLGLSVACAGGVGSGIVLLHNHNMNNLLVQQEEFPEDCVEEVEELKTPAGNVGDPDSMVEENAAKMWAVGKALGLTDEQCAGMLGNCEVEGHFDPTSMETIFYPAEAFDIDGQRKSVAKENMDAFFWSVVRPAYNGSSVTLNMDGYRCSDGTYCPGIGLFAYTGENGHLLMEYAEAAGMDWWEFDLQMAFAIDAVGGYGGGNGGAAWLTSWNSSPGSPAAAAAEFNLNFEGNGTVANDKKGAAAETWYAKFKGTMGDEAYAQSIIALADSISGGHAAGKKTAEAEDECAEAKQEFDNSDLARAAVAYAYETTDQGNGNNGTELYQFVHDTVAPGDPWYQSCDRGVATAVRWTDYDDDFPMGATDQQDAFCQANSSQWEHIGEFGVDVQYEDLEPGDILITNAARRTSCSMGHIVIYVSNEIVKEKFPSSNASFVSASFEERSPGCEDWTDGKFFGDGYYVYRCVVQDNSGQFKNIAEGKNLNDR